MYEDSGVLILSRQKRKLDEMYDQLRNEYESLKRSAHQPANNYLARPQPELFAGMPNMMDGGNHLRQGNLQLLCTQFALLIMSLILAIYHYNALFAQTTLVMHQSLNYVRCKLWFFILYLETMLGLHKNSSFTGCRIG